MIGDDMICPFIVEYYTSPRLPNYLPNRRQAIIWTNANSIYWRIYAAMGGGGGGIELMAWYSEMPISV